MNSWHIPPVGLSKRYDDIAVDNLGVYWLTWRNRLYGSVPGVRVPVFGPDDVNPFIVPGRFEVAIDPKGNAVFQARDSFDQAYILRPRNPLVPARIVVEKAGIDSIHARVFSSAPGPLTIRWRLDGGPWQWSTKRSDLNLRYLSNGSHRLEAIALDRNLESAPEAVTNFEIQCDPAMQLAGFMRDLLHGTDAERSEVVAKFSPQPAAATAALQAARLIANDDQRWWIDVALQELDRAVHHSTLGGNEH